MGKSDSEPNRLASWEIGSLCAGALVYLFSFSLVAVDTLSGLRCAGWALLAAGDSDPGTSQLAFFGGLINPLVVLYVIRTAFRPIGRIRTYLAIAIVSCMPLTWIALFRMNMQLHVGHFAWITGISLMVIPALLRIPVWPDTRCLAAFTLALWIWWGVPQVSRLSMRPASAQDDFYYVVAWNFKEPLVCEKIDSHAIGRSDQRDSDGGWTYMRSDCYRNVSALRHDPALCERIESAGLDQLIGSRIAKSECREHPYTRGTASPADGQEFVRVMRAAGYGDKEIEDWFYHANSPNDTQHSSAVRIPVPKAEDYWDFFFDIANPLNVAPSRYSIAESAHWEFLARVLAMK